MMPIPAANSTRRGTGRPIRNNGAKTASGFVLIGALYTKLVLNPRYFMLAAVAATLVLAVWLDRLPARWRIGLLAAIVASDLILMGAGNAHPHWQAEALVAAARAHQGHVQVDRGDRAAPAAVGPDREAHRAVGQHRERLAAEDVALARGLLAGRHAQRGLAFAQRFDADAEAAHAARQGGGEDVPGFFEGERGHG